MPMDDLDKKEAIDLNGSRPGDLDHFDG